MYKGVKWQRSSHRGVRYYEHPVNKYGIMPDRYYAIRYRDKVAGRTVEEAIGWSSEVDKTKYESKEQEAIIRLNQLKSNVRAGEGATSLREKRAQERDRREAEEVKQITFGKFFDETYMSWKEANAAPNTSRTEKLLYEHWIKPVLQGITFADLSPVAVERVKAHMAKAGKSAKTITHTLGVIRQVINFARQRNVYQGENVVSRVKKPRVDNAKLRYLTSEELNKLLITLRERSADVADQALLSVSCGLRFGECAGLEWTDVNLENKTLAIRDAKTGSRTVFMSAPVETMLRARYEDGAKGLVFPDENGKQQARVSKTFQRVCDDLFNKDVEDRRLRVTFHGLRHTFGSLLYQESGDLYLTGKALGHKTLVMAQRYAKMSETRLRHAFDTMSKVIENGKKKTGEAIEGNHEEKRALKNNLKTA
jgi:integrase